jgi:hypothetical protein
MGALSLLRAMRSAAIGSAPRLPNLSCDPLLERGELLHPRDTRAPLPAAPIPSGLAVGCPAGRRCPTTASHRS